MFLMGFYGATARTVTDGKRTSIGNKTCRLAIKVKAGTTGCNITCPEIDEDLTGASSSYYTGVTAADKKGLFEGEQSNPDKEYDANGDMYLTWYVQISEKNALSQAFNFTLTNQLNSENDYITHFKLWVMYEAQNPLWWVAQYHLAQDQISFSKIESISQGYRWKWNSVMNMSYAYQNSSYNGWKKFPSSTDASRTIEGIVWHLPTIQELYSIMPVKAGTVSGNLLVASTFSAANTATPTAADIMTETECVFGWDATTQGGISPRSYWGPAGGSVRYAVRFIGTNYCSAWRYQWVDYSASAISQTARVVITSRLIDKIEASDVSSLASELNKMMTDATYWSTGNLSEENGGASRTFYATGHTGPTGAEGTNPRTSVVGKHSQWWTATEYSAANGYCGRIMDNNDIDICISDPKTYTYNVRLFRDK